MSLPHTSSTAPFLLVFFLLGEVITFFIFVPVKPYISSPKRFGCEHGCNMFLWNVGIHAQDYTTQKTAI
jgi:hypothetical protein